jgi:hypothetical protein
VAVTCVLIPSSRKTFGVLKNKSVLRDVMQRILADGYKLLKQTAAAIFRDDTQGNGHFQGHFHDNFKDNILVE